MTRQEIIDFCDMKAQLEPENEDIFKAIIKALEQESKTGHWIFTKTIFDKHGCTAKCSFCHKKWKTYDEIRFKKEHNYCPNCGAKMESEDKE